jgi:hypothetical protein
MVYFTPDAISFRHRSSIGTEIEPEAETVEVVVPYDVLEGQDASRPPIDKDKLYTDLVSTSLLVFSTRAIVFRRQTSSFI